MALETVREFVIDKDKAPEELARFDKVALKPGEGLVDISEESDHRVRDLGELVVGVSLAAGYLTEVPALEESTEIEDLRRRVIELEEERTQHLLTIEELRRERDELERKFENRLAEELQKIRAEFEAQKTLAKAEAEPKETPADAEEPTRPEEAKSERIFPGTVVDLETDDERNWGLPAVSGIWSGPSGQRYITVMEDGEARSVPVENISIHEEEVETTPVTPPPTPSERVRYNPRPRILRRLQNRTPWAAPTREYYVDDRGPYYLDEDERAVYVSEEEVGGRQVGGLAIAGTVVLSVAAWELIGERIFGIGDGSSHTLKEVVNNQNHVIHNQTLEINGLHRANNHLNHVLNNQATEITDLNKINEHVSDVDHHLSGEIKDLRHRIAEGQQDQLGAIHRLQLHELKERVTGHPLFFGFRYPWDYFANKVGIYRASSVLHNLATQAAEHGHRVQWFGSGRHQMLKIDGTFNTKHVVGVLNQFRK